jgi:hypothetical protein
MPKYKITRVSITGGETEVQSVCTPIEVIAILSNAYMRETEFEYVVTPLSWS